MLKPNSNSNNVHTLTTHRGLLDCVQRLFLLHAKTPTIHVKSLSATLKQRQSATKKACFLIDLSFTIKRL